MILQRSRGNMQQLQAKLAPLPKISRNAAKPQQQRAQPGFSGRFKPKRKSRGMLLFRFNRKRQPEQHGAGRGLG